MTLSAGRLRHRVRVEVLVPLEDSNGNVIQDPNTGEISRVWQLLVECWAAIEPISGREFIQSQATQSQVTTRITIRRQDYVVNAGMRVIHGVLIYNIEAVLWDKDSGLEYMTLPCSLGVNRNGA